MIHLIKKTPQNQRNPKLAPVCPALSLVPAMFPCMELARFVAIAGPDRAYRAVKEFRDSSLFSSLATHCACFASSCCWGFWWIKFIQSEPLKSIVAHCC